MNYDSEASHLTALREPLLNVVLCIMNCAEQESVLVQKSAWTNWVTTGKFRKEAWAAVGKAEMGREAW